MIGAAPIKPVLNIKPALHRDPFFYLILIVAVKLFTVCSAITCKVFTIRTNSDYLELMK